VARRIRRQSIAADLKRTRLKYAARYCSIFYLSLGVRLQRSECRQMLRIWPAIRSQFERFLSFGISRRGESIEELERRAASFPSMGGAEIGPFLRSLARDAPPKTAIVEVGCWLGAGTAQLALGLRDRGVEQTVKLHTYDRWTASPSEAEKAMKKAGIILSEGYDTLPLVKEALRPFGVGIKFHKGDIADIRWKSGPISVYIDDASKKPVRFHHVLRTFGPSWVPNVTTIVLMDYHFWEKSGSEAHKCQKYFMEAHAEYFSMIAGFRSGSNAAFKYCKQFDFERLDFKVLLSPSAS
jgi:hypothetical protein